ncbi:MAG TPA: hypothetical protein VJY34_27335 [Roseiarcus sp.]|nr:hypothetical protein [Roseiarcus sp.]
MDGTWNLTLETPIGTQESTLEAKAADGVLTGTQSSPDGSQAIQDGAVNGDEASWSVTITSPMPMTLEFKGTVDGHNISGSVKLGMFGEAKFTGVRAQRMAIDGTWNLTLETPIGTQESTLEAKAADGVLTGTQSSPDGSQAIQDGVINGDEASWSVTITSPMPMTLEFKGTVDRDAMSGSVKLGMFGEAKFTGVRA